MVQWRWQRRRLTVCGLNNSRLPVLNKIVLLQECKDRDDVGAGVGGREGGATSLDE